MAKERKFQAIRIYETGYNYIMPAGLSFIAKNKTEARKIVKTKYSAPGCKVDVWEKTNA